MSPMPAVKKKFPSRAVAAHRGVDARVPQQTRSRERVAQIVDAYRELVGKSDIMSVTMTDVARHADIPIGSLYQYFPTKEALIRSLFERRMSEHYELMRVSLASASSRMECAQAIRKILMHLYSDNYRDSFLQAIWAGVQVNRNINASRVEQNKVHSQGWFEIAQRAQSRVPKSLLRLRATILNEMWSVTIQLAITLPKAEGVALMEESIAIGLRELGMDEQGPA